MKALTVQQPWAWSVIYAGKNPENRTQAWAYRGPVAIHAGKRFSARGAEHPGYLAAMARATAVVRHRVDVRGAILGVVDLVDAHISQAECLVDGGLGTTIGSAACCDSPWAETSYAEHGGKTRRDVVHLVLERPRPLIQPVPAKGRLGLWTPTDDVLQQVKAQLPPACRVCGCTDDEGCWPGCWWVEPDLCSSCYRTEG